MRLNTNLDTVQEDVTKLNIISINKLPDVFISYAADVLVDTTQGLNRTELVKQCNKYAINLVTRFSRIDV